MDSIQEMALDIITLLPQVFLCEWFLCRLLSPRNFLGFCVVYGGLNVFLHILFLRILYTSLLIKSIIMLLVNFAIVIAFCNKKWISSISLSAFSYIVLILADVITLAMSQYILQIPFQKSTDGLVNAFSPYLFYLRCVYLIVLALLIFPLSFLKKQIKTENNCYSIWLVPFLIFQCVMLAIAEYSVISANRTSVPLILSLISIAILSCLSMYTTIWAHLKNCAQHQAILRSIELKSYHRALQNQSESVWEKEQQILQLRTELKKKVENICSQLRIHRQDPAKIQDKEG